MHFIRLVVYRRTIDVGVLRRRRSHRDRAKGHRCGDLRRYAAICRHSTGYNVAAAAHCVAGIGECGRPGDRSGADGSRTGRSRAASNPLRLQWTVAVPRKRHKAGCVRKRVSSSAAVGMSDDSQTASGSRNQ